MSFFICLISLVLAEFLTKFLQISGIKRKVLIGIGLLIYFLSFCAYILYPTSEPFAYLIISLPVIATVFLTTILLIPLEKAIIGRKELETLRNYEVSEGYLKFHKLGFVQKMQKKEFSLAYTYLSSLKKAYCFFAILYYISILSPLVFHKYWPHKVDEVTWNGFENVLFTVILVTHIYSYWIVPSSPFLLIYLKSKLGHCVSRKDFERMLKVNLVVLGIGTWLLSTLIATSFAVRVPLILEVKLLLLFAEGVLFMPIILVYLMAYNVPKKIEEIAQKLVNSST
ncbi:MAG: hypothetical protein QXJ27_00515 [Thermoplasmata archaeon]